MTLMDFLRVCNEPVTVEHFDETGEGTNYYFTGKKDLVVRLAVALYQGEEYGLTGYEEVESIWHNDGVLTVTLKEPEGC